MWKNIVAASLVMSLAACASSGTSETQAASGQPKVAASESKEKAKSLDDMVCRTERPIGSNRTKRTCRTKEQIEQDRENAQHGMTEQQRGM